MNLPIQVDASDFDLQSIKNWQKIPKKRCYILLIKSFRCHFCVEYMPIFEQFAVNHSDVGFLVLEISDSPKLMHEWKELYSPAYPVSGYPTVVLYNNSGDPEYVIKNRNNLTEDITKFLL
jgi:thiol-disulfide isomerase/thioredoxin